MKNKKLVLSLVAFVAVVAVLVGVYFATRPETQQGNKTITVTVIHKDKTEKVFTYHTDEEKLDKVLLAEGLIAGEVGQYGLYVTEVNGIVADYNVDQTYWAFYVDGEYAMSGVDTTDVADGATYSFKVEK